MPFLVAMRRFLPIHVNEIPDKKIKTGYNTVKATLQLTVGVKVNIHVFLLNKL